MGPIAARKARRISRNVRHILAIELLAACQGLDLIEGGVTSTPLEAVRAKIRNIAPKMDVDRSLHKEIESISGWIGSRGALETVETAGVLVH